MLFQYSIGILIIGLGIATGSGCCSLVSVQVLPKDDCWVLLIEISLSNTISSDKPFVTITAGQDPPFRLPLKPFNDGHWNGIWTDEIDPTLSLPEYIVTFLGRFDRNLNRKDKARTWELDSPQRVRR